MHIHMIAAALAASFALPALAQTTAAHGSSTPQTPTEQAAALMAAGPHMLTDFELYYLLNGRSFVGRWPNGRLLERQYFNGGTTTFGGATGSYTISGGWVRVEWPNGDRFSWGVRTDGAGNFYSVPYGNQLTSLR